MVVVDTFQTLERRAETHQHVTTEKKVSKLDRPSPALKQKQNQLPVLAAYKHVLVQYTHRAGNRKFAKQNRTTIEGGLRLATLESTWRCLTKQDKKQRCDNLGFHEKSQDAEAGRSCVGRRSDVLALTVQDKGEVAWSGCVAAPQLVLQYNFITQQRVQLFCAATKRLVRKSINF